MVLQGGPCGRLGRRRTYKHPLGGRKTSQGVFYVVLGAAVRWLILVSGRRRRAGEERSRQRHRQHPSRRWGRSRRSTRSQTAAGSGRRWPTRRRWPRFRVPSWRLRLVRCRHVGSASHGGPLSLERGSRPVELRLPIECTAARRSRGGRVHGRASRMGASRRARRSWPDRQGRASPVGEPGRPATAGPSPVGEPG